MSKNFRFLFILIICLVLVATLGCTGADSQAIQETDDIQTKPDQTFTEEDKVIPNVERVEVIHFHSTRQCYSCITVGEYTDTTLKKYFSDELMVGKITFEHINIDLPENKVLVEKYGATGSAIWVGMYSEVGFRKEENVNVWYKLNNQTAFEEYFSDLIEKRLNGVIK